MISNLPANPALVEPDWQNPGEVAVQISNLQTAEMLHAATYWACRKWRESLQGFQVLKALDQEGGQ